MDTGGRPKNWPGEEHPWGKEKQKTLNLTLSHSAASHPSLPLAKREPENKSPPLPLLFSPEAGHFRATLRHPSLGHFHLHQTDSAREPPWPSAIFLSRSLLFLSRSPQTHGLHRQPQRRHPSLGCSPFARPTLTPVAHHLGKPTVSLHQRRLKKQIHQPPETGPAATSPSHHSNAAPSLSFRRPAFYCSWDTAAPPDLPTEAEEKKTLWP